MDELVFRTLLQSYLSNELHPSDLPAFLEAVKSGAFDHLLKASIQESLGKQESVQHLSGARSSTIKEYIFSFERQAPVLMKKNRAVKYWLYAAAAAVAGIIFLIVPLRFNSPQPDVGIQEEKSEAVQQQYIHLPDGSLVILNKNSRLDYPDKFGKNKREVSLTGEAYFDIRHDDRKPFIVHTKHIHTTVLGTAFNIRAYPGSAKVIVTVQRGKVKVSDDSKDLGILTRNNQLSVNTSNNSSEQKVLNADIVTGWTSNYLVIDDLSLEEAAVIIGRRFNTKVVIENESMKNCHLTAMFMNGESLKEVMEVISGVLKAAYRIENSREVFISGEGCG